MWSGLVQAVGIVWYVRETRVEGMTRWHFQICQYYKNSAPSIKMHKIVEDRGLGTGRNLSER